MSEHANLWRRVWNALGFGQLKTTDDSGPSLSAEAQMNALETRDKTPVIQHFGLASNPPADTDAVLVFVGGDRSNGVVVATNHQPSRPRNQQPGETTVFNNFKMTTAFTKKGITINADGVIIDLDSAGGLAHVTASKQVTIDSPLLQMNGKVIATGDVIAGSVSLEQHVHIDDDGGTPGTTGIPVGGSGGGGTGTGGSPTPTPGSSGPVATQSYVNSALLGDLTPASVTISQVGLTSVGAAASPLPSALVINRSPANAPDSPLAYLSTSIHFAGLGGSGATTVLQATSNVGNLHDASGAVVDGPGNNAYNFVAELNMSALKWSGADSTPGAWSQHVAEVASATRSLPPGGVPAGKQMAQMWARWTNLLDTTNLPSSIGNALLGNEMDVQANNRDDGGGRIGIGIFAVPAIPVASGGYPNEWGTGLGFSGHGAGGQLDGFFRVVASLGGPFSVACVDTRGGQKMDTTVKTSLAAPSTALHLNNVWGFTSAGFPPNPVSAGNAAPIHINGTAYTQTGWATDGPGTTSGTITLSTNVSVADGAAGNTVSCASHTIWMNTGDDIAFDLAAGSRIYADTGGALNFTVLGIPGMKLSAAGLALQTGSMTIPGSIGLFGGGAPGQQVLSYSRSGTGETPAVAAIRQAIAAYGLVKDNTTA